MAIRHSKPTGRTVLKRCGPGFLETYASPFGDMPVLHVSGTPEEMGRQYGALVGDRVQRTAGRMIGLFTAMGVPEELVCLLLDKCWTRLESHTPERYLREMAAIAEGAQSAGIDLAVEDIQRLTTVTNFDLYKREERAIEFLGDDAAPLLARLQEMGGLSCTFFAVWGSRTVDGKLFASRDLDWVSQTGIHEERLVTVYRPEGKRAFVTMDYAGVVGGLAGMNEDGIAFSEIGAFSTREELDGTPWTLIARKAIEDNETFEEAVAAIQNAKHTIGYNYMIADGDPAHFGTAAFHPRAAAFETNFDCCETFFENDPQEQEAHWTDPQGRVVRYGMSLKEAVMRADTAFGVKTRALQAADNGPGDPECDGDPRKGSTYVDCHKPMHDMIRAYETGAEYVFPLRNVKVVEAGTPRKIGVEEALTIAGTVAHNVEKLVESDWNVMSVVYAPTDLDFWVAFESRDAQGQWKNAPDSGYVRFNLRKLLEAQP